MLIQLRDIIVRREYRFTLGVEEISGRFYVSIPVSNGMADYEEYYEIDRATFDLSAMPQRLRYHL